MTDYCKGCLGIRITDEDNIRRWVCTYAVININGECPCSKCIVKVMCKTICDGYRDFAHGFNNNKLNGFRDFKLKRNDAND